MYGLKKPLGVALVAIIAALASFQSDIALALGIGAAVVTAFVAVAILVGAALATRARTAGEARRQTAIETRPATSPLSKP